MSYPLKNIIKILVENVERYGSPLRIDHKKVSRWAYDLALDIGGETIIYTGLLYQLIPYIKASAKYLERASGGIGKFALLASQIIDLSRLMRINKRDVETVNSILSTISKLLIDSGVKFGYLYEQEPYSGVLLYDIGMIDIFKRHAEKVTNTFREKGVKRIITIDPHTTYVMSQVYPQYIDGFDIQVVNYLDLVEPKKTGGNSDITYVIHDPCIYARLLDIVDKPREIFSEAGIKYMEARRSGRATYCCGGPLESVFPTLSSEIGSKRLSQLIKVSKNIVTLCPICLVNMERVMDKKRLKEIDITDFSLVVG